jgi:mRNA interferase MazF
MSGFGDTLRAWHSWSASGDVLLCDLNPVAGREQGGVRPVVVVVSHPRYAVVSGLFIAVPLTSRHRGLEHHVEIPADVQTGLKQVSYAMTEQVRAISRTSGTAAWPRRR